MGGGGGMFDRFLWYSVNHLDYCPWNFVFGEDKMKPSRAIH